MALASSIALIAGCGCPGIGPAQSSRENPPAEWPTKSTDLAALSRFVQEHPQAGWPSKPQSPPKQINDILKRFRQAGASDHLPYLVEYGLAIHLKNLQETKLARELGVQNDLALAELVRLGEIPKYTTAHQAGWLNNQFHGPFHQSGYCSYQVYIWAKERRVHLSGECPNAARLAELMARIEATGIHGVGGGSPCHYGCM